MSARCELRRSSRAGRKNHLLDLATQRWVKATGRHVKLTEHRWLDGPWGDADRIGSSWVEREAARLGGLPKTGGGGLLPVLADLDGPMFRAEWLRPEVRDFYEETSAWRLSVRTAWRWWARPFGSLLTRLFAKRLDQLCLPMRTSHRGEELDSHVIEVTDPGGRHLGSAWLRRRVDGSMAYSGWYGSDLLPENKQPSIRVVFPLPNGNLLVFLRPEVARHGSLRLVSPHDAFGKEGAYLSVRDGHGGAWVRRIPIDEEFEVYVDNAGVLRTDHRIRFRRLLVASLQYEITRW